jgi:hypothetical protein
MTDIFKDDIMISYDIRGNIKSCSQCPFYYAFSDEGGCSLGLDKMDSRDWEHIEPSDDCPGEGEYELTLKRKGKTPCV